MQSNESRIIDALSDMDDRLEDSGVYELNPDIVAGWVEMCMGALEVLVTAKRGKYPHDPALKQDVECHLQHASVHASEAESASISDSIRGGYGLSGVDDDGILHIHHATARVALALTRKALVEREKREKPLWTISCDASKSTATLSEIARHCERLAYPNSCKVDKVERNAQAITLPFSIIGDDGGYWYYYRPVDGGITYTTSPTRKLDIDCSRGNVTDKCEDKW
jgi:hypothetical protein